MNDDRKIVRLLYWRCSAATFAIGSFSVQYMAAASFVITAFLSAFLLFQIQPLMGKALLPWFGGTPLVWTTCMMFFQALLLAGYAYAHGVISLLRPRTQWLVHLAVMALGLFFARLLPDPSFAPTGDAPPAWQVVSILAVHVGMPFFALSATAPLVQSWFRGRFPGRSPYPLYAVSNAGSLTGVLSYPFVFEPLFALPVQEGIWRWGYLLFFLGLGLSGLSFWRFVRRDRAAVDLSGGPGETAGESAASDPSEAATPQGSLLSWPALSACGSVLLLSTTDQISQDVAASPLFWVVPLSLYLLSFILCFAKERLYHRTFWLSLLPVSVLAIGALLFFGGGWPVGVQLVLYAATLFVGCMVCHGELALIKPAADRLSRYYLALSAGGLVGGILVAVAAPLLFPDMWEYTLGWVALYSLVLRRQYRGAGFAFFQGRARVFWVVFSAGWLVAALIFVGDVIFDHREAYVTTRSFFGRVAVFQNQQKRCMYHGRIRHGCQWSHPDSALEATTYYGPDSGISIACRKYRSVAAAGEGKNLRMGVVGLGVGTAAVFGEKGDLVRFFELDREVERFARAHFSYLSKTAGNNEVVIGDGRLSLERERQRKEPRYDILVLDAFAGDAVPLHLLTREAMDLYWDRLVPGGLLVANISNRHVHLEPLMLGLARAKGKVLLRVEGRNDWERLLYGSTWTIMTDNGSVIESIRRGRHDKPWMGNQTPLLFTDQYSNILELF